MKKKSFVIPLGLILLLLTRKTAIHKPALTSVYTEKDLVWDGKKPEGPTSLTPAQAKQDIDLLVVSTYCVSIASLAMALRGLILH